MQDYAKQKTVLIIGCSNGPSTKHFRTVFGKQHQYVNLSYAGMGNHYIAGRLFEYVQTHGAPDSVYLQFTGLGRIDLALDPKVKIPDYLSQMGTDHKTWLGSGGALGSWQRSKYPVVRRLFAYMYNIKDPTDADYFLSLKEIFSAVELCKSVGVPYSWTSYYDYTNPPTDRSRQDGHIPQLPTWIDTSCHLGAWPLNHACDMGRTTKNEDGVHFDNESALEFLSQHQHKILS